jgi:hypothetical protein
MGYKFSLVLSREVTEAEAAALIEAAMPAGRSGGMVFAADSLPANAEVAVTRIDFDDAVSPSLAEAIESALGAVKTVPGLGVPGLTVPAQPAEAAGDQAAGPETEAAGLQANGGDLVGAAAGSGRAQEK